MLESDFSPSFNAEVNNPWTCSSTPLNVYMVPCIMKYRETLAVLPCANEQSIQTYGAITT
jgi:hypothetical protein